MQTTQKLFTYAMWWRIAYGALRLSIGLALLRIIGKPFQDILALVMQHEIVEDPNDAIYAWVVHTLELHPLSATYFLAGYFIFWGVVDIVLSYSMLKEHRSAFPVGILMIAAFIGYEALRFSSTHSLVLLGVIAVDIVVLTLTWREYQRLRVATQ